MVKVVPSNKQNKITVSNGSTGGSISASGNSARNQVIVKDMNTNTLVNTTGNLAEYYSRVAKDWANSDALVEGEDYSSKYYANESKKQADISTAKATEVVESGNNVISNIKSARDNAITDITNQESLAIDNVNTAVATQVVLATEQATIATSQASIATSKTTEVVESGNTAISNIETAKSNALNDINTTGAEYVNNAEQYAQNALNSANNAKTSEDNALSYKNSAMESSQTATEQAKIATQKAEEAITSADNAKTSETNAKSSETRCEEILSRLGTAIKIKGRVNSLDDLPLSGNLDGDTYLIGEEGLDSYPEYYWYQDHWEFLGTSGTSLSWGLITGNISAQTDLQNALNGKANDSAVVHKTGNETIAGDKTFSNTIKAEHGKFGKILPTYRYKSNETPTTTYFWYKIFQSSTSSQCVNFEIMAHSDNNYPQFAKYTISVSNYTNTSTSIVVYNHGKIGATPNIKVAIDADGNVYLQANCIWDCVLTANNVYGTATVPYTNMGYGAFGTPVGFTSIGMITSTGAIRYLKTSGTVTYYTPEIDALATKATADASGNTITSTYRKISDSYTKTDVYNKAELDTILAKRGDVHTMFDTKLTDHVLTYEESKGWALQGTYVYKEAVAGSRYGYPTFYEKCVQEFNNSSNELLYLKSNVDIIGSLTDNQGVLSGFSDSNYAEFQEMFQPGSNPWEIVMSFVTPSTNSTYMSILGTSGADFKYGVHIYLNTFKMGLELSSNGTSWNITNGLGSNTLLANTRYWVKVLFTGTAYELYISDTGKFIGEEILDKSVASSTPISVTVKHLIGKSGLASGHYFTGAINLNESYINITNERWWTGVDNLEYKKNPNGHIFYNITQKDQVDELFASTGLAWMYGVDTENERIFLPRNNYFEQLTGDVSEVGQSVEAGLPNITGTHGGLESTGFNPTGCFYNTGSSTSSGAAGHSDPVLGFAASRSNPIYGNSDTVQPNAVKKLLYICVGNTESVSSITDVVDITTTNNDTVPLFTGMYFDFTPNNVSWLKGGEQKNSGGVYTFCYNELVNELTIPKYNIKVINEVDMITGVDYSEYWKVNQDEMTFTTPTAISLKAYENIAGVAGNGMTLGFTDGVNNYGFGTIGTNAQNSDMFRTVNYGKSIGETYTNSGTLPSSKCLGITTDQTKSGIEAHLQENSTAQLYFKVANAVQNLELLDAGRIEEAVNKINNNSIQKTNQADIDIVTNWIMPDFNNEFQISISTNKIINIPCDGYFCPAVSPNGSFTMSPVGYAGIATDAYKWARGSAGYQEPWFPIAKGDYLITTASSCDHIIFRPMKGAN